MSETFDVEARLVLAKLAAPDTETFAEVLNGCGWYLDDIDKMLGITAVDRREQRIATSDGRTRPYSYFANGYFSDDRPYIPLQVALSALETPADRRVEAARRLLAARDISDDKIGETVIIDIAAILSVDLPTRDQRSLIFDLLGQRQQTGPLIALAKQWIATAREQDVACFDAAIQIATLLRHRGELADALLYTDAAAYRPIKPRPGEHAVLLTQRAAILLDFHEIANDTGLCREARRCLDQAWAIAPSDATGAVYNRHRQLCD